MDDEGDVPVGAAGVEEDERTQWWARIPGMGVAGGELLIPTFVLLYGADAKLAGSLSLLVSLPTMLVAFFRYSRDQAFTVLGENRGFVVAMAAGSVTGAIVGGLLVGVIAEDVLVPLLAVLLIYSAVKVWRHA